MCGIVAKLIAERCYKTTNFDKQPVTIRTRNNFQRVMFQPPNADWSLCHLSASPEQQSLIVRKKSGKGLQQNPAMAHPLITKSHQQSIQILVTRNIFIVIYILAIKNLSPLKFATAGFNCMWMVKHPKLLMQQGFSTTAHFPHAPFPHFR